MIITFYKIYKIIYIQKLNSPSVILYKITLGLSPSTVHPRELQVPKTYFIVPLKFLERLLCSMVLATFLTYSIVRFPSCLIFLTFFLSLAGV